MSDDRPWLVFGTHGIQVVRPAVFGPGQEVEAEAHFMRISRQLEAADNGVAPYSIHKVRCDDRRFQPENP